jgi:hypothetical protein
VRDHIHIRRFLNRRGFHAGAFIQAVVPDSTTCRDPDCEHRWCVDPVLLISDCYRVTSLDFDLTTAGGRRNSLYKIDVLIDTLTQFREAFVVEATRATERSRSKP